VDDVVVSTRQGFVRGRIEDGVAVFKGIPYAAPPTGARRLRPPVAHAAWSGERTTFDYGPTAPRNPYPPPFDQILREPVVAGDDYLNLNVWTPDPATVDLPVMVWIHGGGFTNGTGATPAYDGCRFACDGVVLVTINYRLGAEGFLRLRGGHPNLGIQDQVAALRWVQDNIRGFGGDPSLVTIFGESAGGMSVATLMAMPSAKGLFRRAIAQSGAGQSVLEPEAAEQIAEWLAARLSVAPTWEAFSGLAIDAVLGAQRELVIAARAASADPGRPQTGLPRLPFAPCIDGQLLPGRPPDMIRAGSSNTVELLVGTNLDEQNLWLVPTGAIDRLDREDFMRAAEAYGLPPGPALGAYRAGRPGASLAELFAALTTDAAFRIPAIRAAEAQLAGGGRAWMYEFAWPSSQFGGRLGACHALEIGFVFDNLARGRSALNGDQPPQELASAMHTAWVRFASTGEPGWPEYCLPQRTTMRYWPGTECVDDPRGPERELWEGTAVSRA
jgi:para-nitrobenzyl esterase